MRRAGGLSEPWHRPQAERTERDRQLPRVWPEALGWLVFLLAAVLLLSLVLGCAHGVESYPR